MTKPPGRRNAELEAWDRELKGARGDGDGPAPAGEASPEPGGQPPQPEVPDQPTGEGPGAPPPAPGSDGGEAPPSPGAAAAERGRPASPPPDAGVATQGDSESVAQGRTAPVAGEESSPAAPATWSSPDDGVTTEVLLRDLIIFQVKLLLDGLKDIVLSPLSIAAVLWDLVPSRNAPRGRAFYQILKVGERFDLWLNLYNPSHAQRQDHEGLLEAGAHSADSLMGKLEQLARTEAEKKKGWQGVVQPPPRGQKPEKGNDLEA